MMGRINGIAPSQQIIIKSRNSAAIVARRPRPACRSRTYQKSSRKWFRAVDNCQKNKSMKNIEIVPGPGFR